MAAGAGIGASSCVPSDICVAGLWLSGVVRTLPLLEAGLRLAGVVRIPLLLEAGNTVGAGAFVASFAGSTGVAVGIFDTAAWLGDAVWRPSLTDAGVAAGVGIIVAWTTVAADEATAA